MDNRTLLAVILSITVYYTWYSIFLPPAPIVDESNSVALSEGSEVLPSVAQPSSPSQGSGGVSENKAAAPPVAAPTLAEEAVAEPAEPAIPQPPIKTVNFNGCETTGLWTTDGGGLSTQVMDNYRSTFEITPIYSWLWGSISGSASEGWKPYGEEPGPVVLLTEEANALVAGVGEGNQSSIRYELVSQTESSLEFRGTAPSGLIVHKRITVDDTKVCFLNVEIEWSNPAASPFTGPVWLGISDNVDNAASGMMAMYGNARSMSRMVDDDVLIFAPEEDAEATQDTGKVDWFGVAGRYFGLFVLPTNRTGASVTITQSGDETAGYRLDQRWVRDVQIEPSSSHSESFKVYAGSLDMDYLTGMDESLENVIQFGWFSFFARPLLWFLKVFYAGIGDWGFSIIMLTLMVKVIFYPLTNTAFRSSQAMAALQPKMQEMRTKFKDKPEELNRRMVELFRENNVNPLGGCLPMLLQMPVWFALYRVLLNSVELYHTKFFYIQDLSSIDPYGIMPAIVVALMVVQQSFMPTGNMDPAQARMMKLMPLVFGIFFFSFPAGLVLYIFVNMLLSIAQQWLIRRTFNLSETKGASAA
jgi:YidC/Oxa1 family membrane protein insertase